MALDWKKAGLAAINPMAAANVAAGKKVFGEKGSTTGYDPTRDESRKEQRWERKAERGSTRAAGKLAEQRLAEEEAAATGKAAQSDITAAFTPYQEQVAAGEQSALREMLEGEGGRMSPGGKMQAGIEQMGEATKEKMAAGYASIKDVMDKSAAIEKQNLRTLLFARGDAELAAQMQMVQLVSGMLANTNLSGAGQAVQASPVAAPTPETGTGP
tara:strand:- start:12535 stop:13176 length:642 start_codon:yes stop_codon:yes gene_type:complete